MTLTWVGALFMCKKMGLNGMFYKDTFNNDTNVKYSRKCLEIGVCYSKITIWSHAEWKDVGLVLF